MICLLIYFWLMDAGFCQRRLVATSCTGRLQSAIDNRWREERAGRTAEKCG